LTNDDIAYLPWRSAGFTFNASKPFFDSDAYSISILKGLITSSGGLTESTLKASQNSLFEYLSEMSKVKGADGKIDTAAGIASKKRFITKLSFIMESCHKQDRVTVPLMKTLEMLLTSDYLADDEVQADILELHRLCVAECSKSKNIVKLMASVGVFAGMLCSSNADLCRKALKTLLFLLYQAFPKVRKLAAEKLYTGLLTMEEYDHVIPGGEDAYDEVNDLISETDWSQDVKALKAET
jgi:tubulin-specific chaperone D